MTSKVDNILTRIQTLCINLDIDGVSIDSRSHTHPSHSQPLVSYLLPSPQVFVETRSLVGGERTEPKRGERIISIKAECIIVFIYIELSE